MKDKCAKCNDVGWTWETFPRKEFLAPGMIPLHNGKRFKTKCDMCNGAGKMFSISDILIETEC